MNDVAEQIKSDEGFVPHAYRDHLGYLTIGYGFLIDEDRRGRIPKEVAEYWLHWEIGRIEQRLMKELWWHTQPKEVRNALINMAYQLGISGLLSFRRMISHLQLGDRNAAADEALDSRWARQTPERANRISAAIRG